MVDYWDTSAIVPLLVHEVDSAQRQHELTIGGAIVTWWGTSLELNSALARRYREGTLKKVELAKVRERLQALQAQWIRVTPGEPLMRRAERLLWLHPLRAADAFQLAAALIACREDTRSCKFHSGNQRLLEAASIEGFLTQPAPDATGTALA